MIDENMYTCESLPNCCPGFVGAGSSLDMVQCVPVDWLGNNSNYPYQCENDIPPHEGPIRENFGLGPCEETAHKGIEKCMKKLTELVGGAIEEGNFSKQTGRISRKMGRCYKKGLDKLAKCLKETVVSVDPNLEELPELEEP